MLPRKTFFFSFATALIILIILSFSSPAFSDEFIPIVFPVAGNCSFTDTFGASRGGGTRTHEGIDIIANKMTPVLATVDGGIDWLNNGEQTSTANGLPYYNLMLRGDDGNDYFYIHLNNDTPGTDDGMGGPGNAYAAGIANGVRVIAGQHIGYVGDSGNAENTVSHLHFEMHQGGYKNPVNSYTSLVLAQTGNYFKDVKQDHWCFEYVCDLVRERTINGYTDGTFRPVNPVTRAEFVKMVITVSRIETTTAYSGYFSDVPVEHWAWPYLEAAKRTGIISGESSVNFRPDEPINRAEAANFIFRACSKAEDPAGDPFIDVAQDFWAYPSIMTIRKFKIISGYPDGTYRPLNQINRAEASKVLHGLRLTPQ